MKKSILELENVHIPDVFVHDVSKSVDPKFIKPPSTVTYTMNDKLSKKYYWEMNTEAHDTVHILVNDLSKQCLVLVKQLRIPVLVNQPNILTEYKGSVRSGLTVELCAGLIDKVYHEDKIQNAFETAKIEVLEELGYNVDENLFIETISLGNIGQSASLTYLFYATVTEDDYVGQQLGEHEFLAPIYIKYDDIANYISASNTDNTTKLALLSFIQYNKKDIK